MQRFLPLPSPIARRVPRPAEEPRPMRGRTFAAALALGVASALLTGSMLTAQTAVPAQSKQAVQRHRVNTHQTATSTHSKPVAAADTAATPAAAPAPQWPVQEKPQPAKVTWDSHGLEIQASNSSLIQILHEVGTDTGARVEGLNQDQRVFGTYGPGPAREVLSQLLDGSGYNVMMVGDQGGGAPREIVLSAVSTAGPQQAPARPPSDDSDTEERPDSQPPYPIYPEPPRPVPIRNPFGGDNGQQPTPQQVMQQMQERREQIEQQQQQQQEQQNEQPPQQ